jgi:DNA-binding response OmpR family regulator
MSKGNILIAEDDTVLRNLYVKKFSVSGYQLRTASNGQEALEMIRKEPPEVLVLDIHMPVMDGFQVLQQLPKESRTYPVIMLSNFADERNRQTAVELGADDFFVKKDMTIKSLLEMVERVMKIRKS